MSDGPFDISACAVQLLWLPIFSCPLLLPQKRGTAAPTFQPMSIVAKWSPVSATAEQLYKFCISFPVFRIGEDTTHGRSLSGARGAKLPMSLDGSNNLVQC